MKKPVNPKDSIGSTKLPIHLWPETATIVGSLGLMDGAGKYGRSNYRATPVRASIYYDACRRHLAKWFAGEDRDKESSLPHMSHALACLAIIVDAQAARTLIDDRNFNDGYSNLVEELTPLVNHIVETHRDKNPKHYSIKDVLVVPEE